MNASETEVLADVDHGAAKPGIERDTRSAGWFTRFVVDPIKGLFATLKLTKHGKELLENREYRYISPSFSLDEDGRPVELHTASLTNLPAFKGHINPILNTEAVEVSKDEGKIITMEMTKEELIDLIKETVKAMDKTEEKVEEVEETKEEVKEEEAENACAKNACSEDKEEVTNAETEAETKEEVKEDVKEEVKEEAKPEEKEEEKKEEVIKMEALNSAPTTFADVSGSDKWKNLHGDEFWKYLAAHPEIKG